MVEIHNLDVLFPLNLGSNITAERESTEKLLLAREKCFLFVKMQRAFGGSMLGVLVASNQNEEPVHHVLFEIVSLFSLRPIFYTVFEILTFLSFVGAIDVRFVKFSKNRQ